MPDHSIFLYFAITFELLCDEYGLCMRAYEHQHLLMGSSYLNVTVQGTALIQACMLAARAACCCSKKVATLPLSAYSL